MLTPDLLRKIRRLQIKMDKLSTNLLVGLYKSAFKGKGMEFEEVRDYQPGDDVRSIDWNVTARMGNPYIKRFREERELTVILMVDTSASTKFGTHGQLKSTIIEEISGILAFSAIKNQDKIGLILFSDKIDLYIPPKKGSRHVLRIIRELLVHKSDGKDTNLANALSYFGKVQRQKSICFILSDFLTEDFSKQLAPIAKKHDMIAIRIYDGDEVRIPPMQLTTFKDLESQRFSVIDTSSSELKDRLRTRSKQRQKKYSEEIKRMGGDWIEIATDQPYLNILRKFLMGKNRRALT